VTAFLTYDVGTLLRWYGDETPALSQLPYTELDCFLDRPPELRVIKKRAPFQLASHPPESLAGLQYCVYEAFTIEKRVDKFDSKVVRLEDYDAKERSFVIRQCNYSDGLRSNYALDWQGKLRSLLAQDYGLKLPPLDEPRLSNSLGLAVIVWYRAQDGAGVPNMPYMPYLPKRARNLAVFPGGLFHCTASGEAQWKPEAATFDQMFTADIRRELYEEVGLSRADLEWIVPVALCREFLRGGKPQLFFAGLASIGADELAEKRGAAIERQIIAGRQEVLDEVLPVESPEQLYKDLARYGTSESFANMCYAQRCAEAALAL
jgi:hypothetical protein